MRNPEYGSRHYSTASRAVRATGSRILPRTGPVGSIAKSSFACNRSRYRHNRTSFLARILRRVHKGSPQNFGSTCGYSSCCARRASATLSSIGYCIGPSSSIGSRRYSLSGISRVGSGTGLKVVRSAAVRNSKSNR